MHVGERWDHEEGVAVPWRVLGDARDRLGVVDGDLRRRSLVRHQLLDHQGVAGGEPAVLVGHQVGNGASNPVALRQLRQQPLVASDCEQLLGRLRQPGTKVGDAHQRAIAILHRTTLLLASLRKTTAQLPGAVARRSWVLRGVNYAGVAEEARTRGFVPPAFAGFAFVAAGAATGKVKYRGGTGASSRSLEPGVRA